MANAGLRRNSKVACSPYVGPCDYGGPCGKCKRVMAKQASRTRRNEAKDLIRQELNEYITTKSTNLDPEYNDIVNKNFWDLF